MKVEFYSHVMHLCSQVEGGVREGLSALDVLGACFPAGTVSGAPKVRAMEIIDELEPTARGPYAGAVGYLGWGGMQMDTAIAIRTMVVRDGHAHVQAGAGIVADSDPELEYEETLNKARALLRAAAMVTRPWSRERGRASGADQLVVEMDERVDPALEAVGGEPLVRSVHVRPGERESDEKGVRAQHLLEFDHDRDAAAFTREHGTRTERPFECPGSSLEDGTIQGGAPRAAAMQFDQRQLHARRRDSGQVPFEQFPDSLRRLSRHKAEAHLCHGTGGQDGLGAFARVPGEQPVHIAGGARPHSLQRRVVAFTA